MLDELRLEAETYVAVRDRALLRLLAGREAERRREKVDAGARHDALARLRARHGLFSRAALDRWLEANAIGRRRLERIVDAEVQLEAGRVLAGPALPDHLLDELRLRDDFARFAERARSKQAFLEGLGLDDPGAEAPHLAPPAALRAWYFEQRLGQPVPDDIDAAARDLGFADRSDFDRALRREWLYLQASRGRHLSDLGPAAEPIISGGRAGYVDRPDAPVPGVWHEVPAVSASRFPAPAQAARDRVAAAERRHAFRRPVR